MAIRDVFNCHEPLVTAMEFDSELDRQKLLVKFSEGFMEPGRFDIR